MKILLLGKGGQIGWELQRSLAPLGELIALDVDSRQLCGDLTRLDDLAQTVRAAAFDLADRVGKLLTGLYQKWSTA